MKIRLLCLTVLLLCCLIFSAQAVDTIEIAFRLGSPGLLVNGRSIEAPAPYAENGTTLVPLRIVSEAFGADVLWNAEASQITVSLFDTELAFILGNSVAHKNGTPSQLPLAPALIDGLTMVPIRFIAESFDADVLYDEKTASVLVRKAITNSRSAIDYTALLKHSQKPRVGDSYVGGWAMDRSDLLFLKERSFDGRTHIFSLNNQDGSLTIHVADNTSNDIAEYALDDYRAIGNYATVSYLDTDQTPSGIPYAHIQYKTTASYYSRHADERTYFHSGNKITVVLSVSHEIDDATLASLHALLDTFDFNFDNTAEDLSDVNPSTLFRRYRNTELGISMDIPAIYGEHISAMNNISFTDTQGCGVIQLSMYSSLPNSTCFDWAKSDYTNNQALFSPTYTSFSEIFQTTIDGEKAYMYSYTTEYNDTFQKCYDIFIERDSYFYNIGISHDADLESAWKNADLMQVLKESVHLTHFDPVALGTMLRTDSREIIYTDCIGMDGTISFQKPRTWQSTQNADSLSIVDGTGHTELTVLRYPISAFASLSKACTAIRRQLFEGVTDFRLIKEQKTEFLKKSAYFIEATSEAKNHYAYVVRGKQAFYCILFSVHPLYDNVRHEEIRTIFFQSFSLSE